MLGEQTLPGGCGGGVADGATTPTSSSSVLPQATFLFSLIKYTPLTYNKKYTYPWWGDALGWLLALSSMICIPAWSIYKLRTLKGPLREVGEKQWGMGTSLDGRWVAFDGCGVGQGWGAGVQRDHPARCGYQGSRGSVLGSLKKEYRITARRKL